MGVFRDGLISGPFEAGNESQPFLVARCRPVVPIRHLGKGLPVRFWWDHYPSICDSCSSARLKLLFVILRSLPACSLISGG